MLGVFGAEPQDDLSPDVYIVLGPIEELVVISESAGANEIERRQCVAEVLETTNNDFDTGQIEMADDLEKERRFLHNRFNQKDFQVRGKKLKGQAGEAGSGTDVGEPTCFNEGGVSCKHGLAEVTAKNFLGISDGSQVNFMIPKE